MNSKLWIGDDNQRRKEILSMIDIEKYGGEIYFKNCTSIYFYRKSRLEGVFDVRIDSRTTKDYFNNHRNKEIL